MATGTGARECAGASLLALLLALFLPATGCRTTPAPGARQPRRGDEIVAAGQFIHTGTRVVTWLDPAGYDAYRVERRFSPLDDAGWDATHEQVKALTTPNRYGLRRERLTPEQIERVRGGGWDFATLTNVIDQFVLHFDACGTSRQCFKVLQDQRGLSVHFLLDLDGTIYQTLDLKERAWHATSANTRSIGIEIANLGAYPTNRPGPLDEWYQRDAAHRLRIRLPARLGDGGIRTPGFIGHPARDTLIHGTVQGAGLVQYDFTPQQYDALIHLTAALCRTFPELRCDYPRDAAGHLVEHKLSEDELRSYQGILGHYHIQTNKVDPGPAFQWDHVIGRARRMLHLPALRSVPSGP